jgi:hypothetical protein
VVYWPLAAAGDRRFMASVAYEIAVEEHYRTQEPNPFKSCSQGGLIMPRADLNSLSPTDRTSLVNLIISYLNDAIVASHTTIIHQDIHIFTGHRAYIEGLETFLASNGGSQFVPLPSWNPARSIPAEFNIVKPRDNGTQRLPLVNLNPNRPKPSQFSIPAVWNFQNGDVLGNAVNPWHGDVHGVVGGTMSDFNQASAAPIFWCWHAYVDEIYSDWEQRNLADGRPIWIGNFSRSDRAEILYYYPRDTDWWLGSNPPGQFQWRWAGNTLGFGQVWDGRPFWIGNFSRADRAEMLFYFPGDGNWWLGSHPGPGGQLQWSFAGNRCNPRV